MLQRDSRVCLHMQASPRCAACSKLAQPGYIPDGQPKVGRSKGAVVVLRQEQKVVRLHITVDDALGMALGNEAQDGADDAGNLLLCDCALQV